MALEDDVETFRRELPRLLGGHEGEYVLIKGGRVDSLWPTEDDAYVAGCERFGVEPFLVEKVQASEKPLCLFIDLPNRCHP